MTVVPVRTASASVVIPAHNEAAVIDRCLGALAASRHATDLEVVVAANGCTDETVERASAWRRRLPLLKVLDLGTASKAAALNAGDDHALAYPRVYLDADIELGPGALDAMLAALDFDGARVAAPRVVFDRTGAETLVGLFYDAYEETPYVREGLVGLGVYAMNEAGRARFGPFPALMADDLLVQLHFAAHERVIVSGTFTVRVPRKIADLVRVRTRIARGNADLVDSAALQTSAADPRPASGTLGSVVRRAPRHPASTFVYLAVVTLARVLARRHGPETWLRDASTRHSEAQAPSDIRVAYLVSQYPAPSHTFIEREILALERDGASIMRISVRPTPPELLLSDVMRSEAALTTVVQSDVGAVLRDVVTTVLRHPVAFSRAALRSLQTGPSGLRPRTWQVFYLAEAMRVRAVMRAKKVTHLHAHFANNSADIARHVAAFSREIDANDAITWTFTMHGPTEFENVERHDLAAKTVSADGVACITDFARSQLMRLTSPSVWPRLSVVPMSVDVERFQPIDRSHRTGPMRILFVGRLVPEKGPLLLLEAIERVQAAGTPCELRMIGGGPLFGELQREITSRGLSNSVTLVGALGQDDVQESMKWADVFCLPSFQEGLPVVLMEATAAGLPVVTTTIAGIPELVTHGENGLLVRPGRADLLADSLEFLAADPALRSRLGIQGRERTVARHSTTVAGAKQAHFLHSACAGAKISLQDRTASSTNS